MVSLLLSTGTLYKNSTSCLSNVTKLPSRALGRYRISTSVIFVYPSIRSGARLLAKESLKMTSSLSVFALWFSIVSSDTEPDRNIS